MGQLTVIGYSPGRSVLHRMDPRTKQALVMAISLASVWGHTLFLSVLSLCLFLSFRVVGVRLARLVREIRYFLCFLLFVFLLRSLAYDGGWIPSFSVTSATMALFVCWRLLLIVLMSLLLVATTRIAQLRASMIWYLRPVPFVNEKMAATMVAMVVRFLPMILFQAGEVSDVFRSRGIGQRKNPLGRLTLYAVALIRRVFLGADTFALAMQARCYTEQRTLPALGFSRIDGLALVAALLLLGTLPFP